MLILVRHGESSANAQGLLVGRSDVELTEKGRAQAVSVRRLLYGPVRSLRTSPLRRARDTAAALALDVPAEVDARWIEVDYGEYDCQPLGDVPAEVWREWRRNPDFRPPGGETLAEVDARVSAACDELFADDGAGARAAAGDVVVVSHVTPDKGRGGLGSRRRGPALLAAPSADGVGDPHRVGQRRAGPPWIQRGGARPPRAVTITP